MMMIVVGSVHLVLLASDIGNEETSAMTNKITVKGLTIDS